MRVMPVVACCLLIAACREAPTSATIENDDLQISAAKGGGGSPKVNSVTVTPPSATIQAGNTVQLTATSKPASSPTFTWASSNQSVATVSQTGLVTGVAAGT